MSRPRRRRPASSWSAPSRSGLACFAFFLAFEALALAAAPAQAKEQLVRFRVAAKPVREALIDIALQSGVSLGGQLDACNGVAEPIVGLMSLDDAMQKAVERAHCRFERAADGAIVIRP